MENIKPIIAENLIILRKSSGMTQAEFAEKLNYSDKAISRWEHGDTLPDINTLYEICNYYNISMDDLCKPLVELPDTGKNPLNNSFGEKIALQCMGIATIWMLATVIFVYSRTFAGTNLWQIFLWAIPCSFISLSRFCKKSYNWLGMTICLSGFLWSLITCFFIQFIQYNFWALYLVGIPVQIMIVLWHIIKFERRKCKTP